MKKNYINPFVSVADMRTEAPMMQLFSNSKGNVDLTPINDSEGE